jgi:exonuclease SbcD
VRSSTLVRLLHTSDWHLGHTLKDVSREYEHAAFLAWLLDTCVREAPDVLVITGDVFDSGTPPASAERMWFELLAAARRARPEMDIIAIAGNHDSPARLGAPASILRELGVHVVGGLPRIAGGTTAHTRADHESPLVAGPIGAPRTSAPRADQESPLAAGPIDATRTPAAPVTGALDLDRILIPVAGGRGLVACVPFLRPVDVPPDVEDPLALVYGEVLAAARERRGPEQALVVLGHLYVTGAEPSQLSERRIAIGGAESASLRLFPDDISYVALGHMHRAQRVGRDTIRYAGAPIALSLDEACYRHQVVVVDFDGARVREVRSIEIPQVIEIVRIPARGTASLEEAIAAIAELPARLVDPADPSRYVDDPTRPYLDIAIALDRPEPRLRTLIETALDGKRPRLVQLHAVRSGDGAALGDRIAAQRLAELDPRDVFARLWARSHAEEPSVAVRGAFERLLAEVQGDVEDPAKKREAS